MSNYPDDIREYDHDPRSPFYKNPLESALAEYTKERLYREKIADINGYFTESITEASDEWLKELSNLILQWGDSPSDKVKDVELLIGRLVARRVDEYCTPADDEVLEAVEGDGGE